MTSKLSGLPGGKRLQGQRPAPPTDRALGQKLEHVHAARAFKVESVLKISKMAYSLLLARPS